MTTIDEARNLEAKMRSYAKRERFGGPSSVIANIIRDLIAMVEAQEWQLIETAPKDGSSILVQQGHVVASAGWSRLGGYWQVLPCSPDAAVNPIWPTHWRPLPSPPAASRSQAEERG